MSSASNWSCALLLSTVAACASSGSDVPASGDAGDAAADAAAETDAAADQADAAPAEADASPAGACAAGPEGLACLFDLHDEVAASCDAERLEHLRASLLARRGQLPVWHAGRALFVTYENGAAVAGDFNDWDAEEVGTLPLCDSDIWTADIAVPGGRHRYKLVRDGVWLLDPENDAFAYDDFAGNPDGRNSLLNTHDSGLGHLVQPRGGVCSDALGGCRPLTVYLPPGYGAPASAGRDYPALFLHDGQNVFDDTDCCFGHTGWEINRTLDTEIAAGRVAPVVVVAADHGGEQRLAEYGGDLLDEFMVFQIDTVQKTASELFRLDPARLYIGGSSMGGYAAYRLAFARPELYAGAASLSGSFTVGEGTEDSLLAIAAAAGELPLSLYLDHGGTSDDGADNLPSNVALRDALVDAGFARSDSPGCAPGAGQLCYFHAEGASHDELAWRERTWRFLHLFFPAE